MRKPDDPRTRLKLHEEITNARAMLNEARGRLLEARTREQFEIVLATLRRAAEHVDKAVAQCVSVVARSHGEDPEGGES